ncbi:hypothetical protein BH09PLA1_BH09PLA1_25850 [soil metagenome]
MSKRNSHSSARDVQIVKDMVTIRDFMREGKNPDGRFRTAVVKRAFTPRTFDREDVLVLRQKLAISQAVLAQLTGFSKKTISSWEQGERPVTKPAARALELLESNPDAYFDLMSKKAKSISDADTPCNKVA